MLLQDLDHGVSALGQRTKVEVAGDLIEGINSGPGLARPWRKEKQRIKHVLDSGLVIEVESTECNASTRFRNQFSSHAAIITRTPSPKSSHGSQSIFGSDDSPSTYSSEHDSIPPRQLSEDYLNFELSMDVDEFQLHSKVDKSPNELADQFHNDDVTVTRIPSPESPHHSQFASDDSAIYAYHYPSEWDINPPRQGGDWYFEQSLVEAESDEVAFNPAKSHPAPFYHGDPWRLKFIPTLLGFLGTRCNPWDWHGDEFDSLLQQVWTTVYGEPSWAEENRSLISAHAAESVSAWFDCFGSTALHAVEDYLKGSTKGFSSFSEWSALCKEILQDGRLFNEYSDDRSSAGIYRSVFVLAPLSNHMKAIRGGTNVQGPRARSPYDELAFPFGAIGLAAAAALRALLLFGMKWVTYDNSGNLVIETHQNDDVELPIIDTSFSQATAGGTTRQCALAAYSLPHHELSAILTLAKRFDLNSNGKIEVIVGDEKALCVNE